MPFIANPTYEPAMSEIWNMGNGNPTFVLTLQPHDLITGEIVRLIIPTGFGMVQANNLTGTITVTGLTTFTIDIDSTMFDPFVAPIIFPDSQQIAQVVPVGESNDMLTAATDNILN